MPSNNPIPEKPAVTADSETVISEIDSGIIELTEDLVQEDDGTSEFPEAPTVKRVRQEAKDVLRRLNDPHMYSPDGNTTMPERILVWETPSGSIISAASDKGIRYKDHNEDYIFVHPQYHLAVVIDGIGGGSHGKISAQNLAMGFYDFPGDPDQAVKSGMQYMKRDRIKPEEDGACFASARLVSKAGRLSAEICKAGDTQAIILDPNDIIIWQSKNDSFVQGEVDANRMTDDEALYSEFSNIVTRSISSDRYDFSREFIPVYPGCKIMLCSDGITGNVIPTEIEDLIKGKNYSAQEIITLLANITMQRVANAGDIISKTDEIGGRKSFGTYSDGYRRPPTPDNRSVVIFEVK